MEKSAEKPRSTDVETRARLVAAARECFARDGVRGTRMATVAQAAGMVRQTAYTFVSSREELIELAFGARMWELVPAIVERMPDASEPIPEALADALAVMAEVVRADDEFIEYAQALGLERALQFLTGATAAHEVVSEILRPHYARAAESGLLRPDISLDDTAWWARNVLAPVTMGGGLDGAELRRLLRKFALPALLRVDAR